MAEKDIAFLSATELGTAIREKQISPVEAVEAYLERIDRIDRFVPPRKELDFRFILGEVNQRKPVFFGYGCGRISVDSGGKKWRSAACCGWPTASRADGSGQNRVNRGVQCHVAARLNTSVTRRVQIP